MATTVDDLVVRVVLDSSGAIKGFKDLDGNVLKLSKDITDLGDSAGGAEGAFGSLGASIVVTNQALDLAAKAWQAVDSTVLEAVRAFQEAEDQTRHLGSTLAILGEKDVQGTVDEFQKFSQELTRNSVLSVEQSTKLLSLAKSLGLTTQKAEELVQTSADLAAIQQEDVTTAFEQLSSTLKGSARGIASVAPALKDMNSEALKSGQAIDFLSQKLAGAAKDQLKTFGGQVIQAKVLLNDFQQSAGEGILLGLGIDPNSAKDLNAIREHLDDFRAAVAATVSAVKSFATILADTFLVQLEALALPLKTVVSLIQDLVKNIKSFSLKNLTDGFSQLIHGDLSQAKDTFSGLFDLSTTKQTLKDTGNFVVAAFDDIAKNATGDLDEVDKSLAKVAASGKKVKLPPIVSDETLRLLADLNKKIGELSIQGAKAGAGELMQAGLTAAAKFQELKIDEDKLKKSHGLTKEAQKQLDLAREIIATGLSKDVAEIMRKNLQEQENANATLQDQADSLLATKVEQIEIERLAGIRSIQLEEDKLKREGDITAELQKQFDIRKQKITQIAGIKEDQQVAENDEKLFKKIVAAFEVGAAILGDVFSGQLVNDLADGLQVVANIPQQFLEAFAKIDVFVNKLIDTFPKVFQKVIDKFPAIIDKLVAAFPKFIDELVAALPKLAAEIGKAFPKIVGAIVDAIPKILDVLPAVFDQLIQGVVKAIDKIFDGLPKIIQEFFKVVPQLIDSIIKAIPTIVESLAENIGPMVEAFVEGLTSMMGDIVASLIDNLLVHGGLERIVGALYRAIPRIAIAFVVGVVKGLLAFFHSIAGVFGKIKAPKGLDGSELASNIDKSVKKVIDIGQKVSDNVFKVIDLQAAAKARTAAEQIADATRAAAAFLADKNQSFLDKLIALWRKIYDTLLKPFVDLLKLAWDGVQNLFDATVRPVFEAFVKGVQALWDFIKPIFDAFIASLQAAWDLVKTIFDGIVASLGALWDTVGALFNDFTTSLSTIFEAVRTSFDNTLKSLHELFDNLKDTVQKAFQPVLDVFNGLKDLIGKAFESVKDFFDKLLKGDVEGAFKSALDSLKALPSDIASAFKDLPGSLTTAFSSAGKNIVDSLKTALGSATASFTGIGTSIWSGLKTGIDTIGAGLQAQFDKLNPANLASKIFNFSKASGTGKVEDILGIDIPFANFAQGGVLGGAAKVPGDSLLNDRILALLSPGEAIIPRSLMAMPWIGNLVRQILAGKMQVPRYAYGINDVKKTFGGGGGNPLKSIGGAINDLKNAGAKGFETLGNLSDTSLKYLSDFLQGLDPANLWDKVLDKAANSVMGAFQANHFADGGIVGGMGMAAVGSPGPIMISSGPTRSTQVGAPQFNITMHITTQGQVDGNALYDQFKKRLMQDSRGGKAIIDSRGVRS